MASAVIPCLSPDATEFVRSILPGHSNVIETDSLSESQIEQLLVVLEVELEVTRDMARVRAVSEFAAALMQARKV